MIDVGVTSKPLDAPLASRTVESLLIRLQPRSVHLFRGIKAPMRNDSNLQAGFPTTQWSRVARAGDPSAFAELCAAYWYPIYALIRRKGHLADQALDLTQGYFVQLIEKGTITFADPARGRFRAFLRTDCGYFLADRRDHDRAAKRGGRVAIVSIDAADAETRYRLEPVDNVTPEHLFDRAWALTLLDSVFRGLRRDYESAGKASLFDRLRGVLSGDSDPRAIRPSPPSWA